MLRLLFYILFIGICFSSSAQIARKPDGRPWYKNPADSALVAALCGKQWQWDEGREDKRKLGAFVFSLKYREDGSVNFNNRKEAGFWKISGGKYVYHAADSNLLNKEPHQYGLYSGKYMVKILGDTQLVLSTVPANKKKKVNVFHLFKVEEKIKFSEPPPVAYTSGKISGMSTLSLFHPSENHVLDYVGIFDSLCYTRTSSKTNPSETIWKKNDQIISQENFEKELNKHRYKLLQVFEPKRTIVGEKLQYKLTDYGNKNFEYHLIQKSTDAPQTGQ